MLNLLLAIRMLAVRSKALKYDAAREFVATQFEEHGVSPDAQT